MKLGKVELGTKTEKKNELVQLYLLFLEPGPHDPLNQGVDAIGVSRTVLPDGRVDKAQVLVQHELAVLVEPVQRLVPRVLLQRLDDLPYVLLSHGRGTAG